MMTKTKSIDDGTHSDSHEIKSATNILFSLLTYKTWQESHDSSNAVLTLGVGNTTSISDFLSTRGVDIVP